MIEYCRLNIEYLRSACGGSILKRPTIKMTERHAAQAPALRERHQPIFCGSAVRCYFSPEPLNLEPVVSDLLLFVICHMLIIILTYSPVMCIKSVSSAKAQRTLSER